MSDTATSSASGIQGAQTPTSAAPSDMNMHEFSVQQALGRISTMKLVKIVAVTLPNNGKSGDVGQAGTVDVQLLTNQLDGAGKSTKHGVVHGLPYVRAQGGANAVINDPAVGDIGYIAVADRDTSSTIAKRGQANPGSRRRFSPSDGVYMGGILNDKPKQYVTFNSKGIVTADQNGNVVTMDDNGTTVKDKNNNKITMSKDGMNLTDKNGNVINLQSGGISITVVNLTASGGVTAGSGGGDSVTLQHHTHGGGPPPDAGT